jgi:hypothetical protein
VPRRPAGCNRGCDGRRTATSFGPPGSPAPAAALSSRGAREAGAPITFPNAEILRASLTNFTCDFPFAWDEVSAGVGDVDQMLDGRQ